MINIRTEKIVKSDARKYRKFKGFEMLPQERLPKKYLAAEINCCQVDKSSIRVQGFKESGWTNQFYHIGDRIPEERFVQLMAHIRKCGTLLMEINEEIETLRAEWQGEETFII